MKRARCYIDPSRKESLLSLSRTTLCQGVWNLPGVQAKAEAVSGVLGQLSHPSLALISVAWEEAERLGVSWGPDPTLLSGRLLHPLNLQSGVYCRCSPGSVLWLRHGWPLAAASPQCLMFVWVYTMPEETLRSVCPRLSWLTLHNQEQPFYAQKCPVA